MSHQVNVQSLKCPECGGPIKVTNTSCPHCGVGLLINYAEIIGVPHYNVSGRNVVLDAALLALVEQVATQHGVEIVPAISRDSIIVYVRHVETQDLVPSGVIQSIPVNDMYILMGSRPHWKITCALKLTGDTIYRLGNAYTVGYLKNAEGEEQLVALAEIQEWAKDCVADAFPQIELNPEPNRGIPWKLFQFLRS